MKNMKLILISPLMLFFIGCESKNDSGVGKIHWDRDMCARCVMVVSDRHNTVQLQDPTSKKQYVFDDIGCLAIWLEETKPSFKNSVKIWVNDAKDGKFIDAKTAFYTTDNITPMSFGFSAYESKGSIKSGKEIIDYQEVLKRSRMKTLTKEEPIMKCGAGKCGR
jgi:nitrous oxide reductase accessory protein NosL